MSDQHFIISKVWTHIVYESYLYDIHLFSVSGVWWENKLTWKPEGPGCPCSPLSPAGPYDRPKHNQLRTKSKWKLCKLISQHVTNTHSRASRSRRTSLTIFSSQTLFREEDLNHENWSGDRKGWIHLWVKYLWRKCTHSQTRTTHKTLLSCLSRFTLLKRNHSKWSAAR